MGNEKVSQVFQVFPFAVRFHFPLFFIQTMSSIVMAASAFTVSVVSASFPMSVMPAASVFMVVMMSATSFAFTTAAASAVETVYEPLNLVVCCLAGFNNMPLEVQCLASQRVVKVNGNFILVNIQDFCEESVAVVVL